MANDTQREDINYLQSPLFDLYPRRNSLSETAYFQSISLLIFCGNRRLHGAWDSEPKCCRKWPTVR